MLSAQVCIIIEDYPDYTPAEDTLYLVSNYNNWNPKDSIYQFQKLSNGEYKICLELLDSTLQYKITRGDWNKVEGSKLAQLRDNRMLEPNAKETMIRLSIESWEDLSNYIPFRKKVKIFVNSLPKNTPKDASVYLAGDFNEWDPGDEQHQLKKLKDGRYFVEMPIRKDTAEYKFTRGFWESVEGRSSGRARFNRVFIVDENKKEEVIETSIETWEDLSGSPFNGYTLLLLFAAFQGVLLIFAINTMQDNNTSANRLLSILILLISVALIGRVSIYDRDIFQRFPKLLLLPDMIFFLYAPLFFIYIRKLLIIPSKNKLKQWLFFVPAILHFFVYLPMIFMDQYGFTSQVVDLSLKKVFVVTGGVALIFNLFFWVKSNRVIKTYEQNLVNNHSFEQNVNYLSSIINLKLFCLIVWALTYIIGIAGWFTHNNWTWITDLSTDLVWILFALVVFCLGYFAMTQPEIFKVPEEDTAEALPTKEKIVVEKINSEELLAGKQLLEHIMLTQKPYLNPKLSLAELAEMAGSNVHRLSKVINDGFNKNFFDFVNSYRVEEFKQRMLNDEYKQQTFLSNAFSVGFNSKTAFNRSFKKLTGKTPRQYFKDTNIEA